MPFCLYRLAPSLSRLAKFYAVTRGLLYDGHIREGVTRVSHTVPSSCAYGGLPATSDSKNREILYSGLFTAAFTAMFVSALIVSYRALV